MRRCNISDRARKPSGSGGAEHNQFFEDNEFRISVLSEALKCLPAVIFINEPGNGYHIRDGNGMVIWADDLPKGGGAELIEDLFLLFLQENRSLLTAGLYSDRRMSARQIRDKLDLRKNFTLYNRAQLIHGHFIAIDIRFGSGENYEIKIEQI